MSNLPFLTSQKGQTVLIVLLIMAVILTIGLSTISSSITDVKISQQTEEATRAFYVAESALEEKLQQNLPSLPGTTTGETEGISYTVTAEEIGGSEFVFPNQFEAGETQTFWLVGHSQTGEIDLTSTYQGESVTIYWGDDLSSPEPALMVSYVYKDLSDGNKYKIVRYNYDSNESRRDKNKFYNTIGQTGFLVAGKNLIYSSGSINLGIRGSTIQPYFLRISLIYNTVPHFAAVKAEKDKSIPSQGNCYTSSASVKVSGITKKLRQCKLWQTVPEIFNWGLFSGGGLEKSL